MAVRRLTFTSPIVDELISPVAVAVIPDGCVHTPLRTSSIAFLTLVFTASVPGFILEVRTVRLLVAHLRERYTHAGSAVELGFLIANRLRPSCESK